MFLKIVQIGQVRYFWRMLQFIAIKSQKPIVIEFVTNLDRGKCVLSMIFANISSDLQKRAHKLTEFVDHNQIGNCYDQLTIKLTGLWLCPQLHLYCLIRLWLWTWFWSSVSFSKFRLLLRWFTHCC